MRFGTFELDLTSGELHRGGQKVTLPPKAFEVLKALLERPGEIVSREELRARLWSTGTFVEFDDSLNHAVRKRQVISKRCPAGATALPHRWKAWLRRCPRQRLTHPTMTGEAKARLAGQRCRYGWQWWRRP